MSILQIHGTKDRINPYQGGGDIQDVPYPGAVETVEKWAEFYGFEAEPASSTKTLDLDKRLDGYETTITQYGDGSVELWSINGGGHVPDLSDSFSKHVIEWLMAHPKAAKK